MEYINISSTSNYKDFLKKLSFSPVNYKNFNIKNQNTKHLRELIVDSTGGKEVGSSEYIGKSEYYFIRTKAIQNEDILLNFNAGSTIPIRPHSFKSNNLKEGDILILKDSNVGEVAYVDDNYPNHMLCGGIKKLDILEDKYYILAFMKSQFFKKQLEFLIGKGATIKHAQDKYLDCKIAFPNSPNKNDIKKYIAQLMKSIINKEKEIKKKNNEIFKIIEKELKTEDISTENIYNLISFKDLRNNNRIDSGFYTKEFRDLIKKIENYKHGWNSVHDLGFEISRGQNLQISSIGESIQSDIKIKNFYKLYLPTHISEYGTISKTIYLGNKNNLKCLKKGDLVIGVEGFEKGRSIVVTDDIKNTITNIHGLTLTSKNDNLKESIVVRCILSFMRKKGMLDRYAVGGNGGSLGIKYWEHIKIPNFTDELMEQISKLYFNEIFYPNISNLDDYILEDSKITKESGILNLSNQMNLLKRKVINLIDLICLDEEINIDFKFLHE